MRENYKTPYQSETDKKKISMSNERSMRVKMMKKERMWYQSSWIWKWESRKGIPVNVIPGYIRGQVNQVTPCIPGSSFTDMSVSVVKNARVEWNSETRSYFIDRWVAFAGCCPGCFMLGLCAKQVCWWPARVPTHNGYPASTHILSIYPKTALNF